MKIVIDAEKGPRYVVSLAQTGRVMATSSNSERGVDFSDNDFYKTCDFSVLKNLKLNLRQE